jgi:hypothetical protein
VRTKSGRSGLSVSLAMNSRRSNSYMALSAPSPVARAVMRFSIIIARSSEAGISLLSIISGSRYIMVRGAKSCSCLRGSCGRVRQALRPAPGARRRRASARCASVIFGLRPMRSPRFCARLLPSAVRVRIKIPLHVGQAAQARVYRACGTRDRGISPKAQAAPPRGCRCRTR